MKTKICVYGAGAIGCHIAGHLARSGQCEVSVVDRDDVVSAIQKQGVRVKTHSEDFTVPVIASTNPQTLGIQDYVIVALKIQQSVKALESMAHLIGPDTTIVPPSTGIPYYFFHQFPGRYAQARLPEVDPDESQWRTLPPAQVLPMVFWYGAHGLGPGSMQQDGESGRYPLGELDGSVTPRARLLSELLQAGGLNAPITDNIRGEIWIKFANSLCGNPLAILTLADMNGFASSPQVLSIFERSLAEIDAMAEVFGITIPQTIPQRMAFTLGTGTHKFSMLQDLEQGRQLEIAPFAQSLAAIKRLSGGTTPITDIIQALVILRDAYHQKKIHGM
ncbi:2-dehydropantoate 2-reductase [Sodalis sp. dw_96]|uniref:ketopantoate reductase family protein n=1 Tax=Sodalis sp. dw_96 TaxID=2719794 RepID=UPI001BD3DD7B|nr:2-dehydropantoate 2-reductase [Sodalis sp. dw_96]